MTGKILHTENVGPLVDKINRRDGTHISSLEWQAFDVSSYLGRNIRKRLQLLERALRRLRSDARILALPWERSRASMRLQTSNLKNSQLRMNSRSRRSRTSLRSSNTSS